MIVQNIYNKYRRFFHYSNERAPLIDRLRFGTEKRLKFYEKISLFLRNGVPLDTIFYELKNIYDVYNKRDIRVKVIDDFIGGLSLGNDFSSTLSKWAPYSEVMLVRTGEQSTDTDSLPVAMKNVVDSVRSKKKIIKAATTSLAYPLIVAALLFMVLRTAGADIFPRYIEYSDPSTWSDASYFLYVVSTFIKSYELLIFSVIILSLFLITYSIPHWIGENRRYFDYLPPWSIYKKMESANFLIGASALMKSGTPILETLVFLSESSSPYTKTFLDVTRARVGEGVTGGAALNTGFFDKETAIDIEVYSQSSELSETIEILGKNTIEHTIKSIGVSSAILGTALLLLSGVTVYNLFVTLMEVTGSSASVGF